MITTLDPSLSVRGKIIAALRNDAALNAIVPPSRVYTSKVEADPVWPFIRLGALSSIPSRLDGGAGGDVSGVVHCFTKTAPDPERQAYEINAHIARILDAIDDLAAEELDLGIHVTQCQVIEDGAEADAYHGIVQMSALGS